MLNVEIMPVQDSVVLRARGSELLIMSHHVKELKALRAAKDFSQYFVQHALINRPARKLFEAWLRKDSTIWRRLYRCIQDEAQTEDSSDGKTAKGDKTKDEAAPTAKKETVKKAAAKAASEDVKPAKATKAAKVSEEKEETKKSAKKPAAASKGSAGKKPAKATEKTAKKPSKSKK